MQNSDVKGQFLSFRNCVITALAGAARRLEIHDSNIESLTHLGHAIKLVNVTAKSITLTPWDVRSPFIFTLYPILPPEFIIDRYTIFTNYYARLLYCTIDKVPKKGITIWGSPKTDRSMITNSYIGTVEESGIEVTSYRSLAISNTIIDILEEKSIEINIGGALILRNVTISTVPNGAIILHHPCLVELHSVKFNNEIVANNLASQFTHVYPEVQGIMHFNKVYHSCNKEQLQKANTTCKILLHSEDPNHPGSFDINSGKCVQYSSSWFECDFGYTKDRPVSFDHSKNQL